MTRPLLALAAALALAGARGAAETVGFKTRDGVALAASYRAGAKGMPVLILLHGVGAGRGEWSAFAERLAAEGIGSLALDFRGHGDSGGPPYTTFTSSAAWAALDRDMDAAIGFLGRAGVREDRIGLVGASIGANLAARAAARHPSTRCLALLSPGIEYRGIEAEPALSDRAGPLLLAAAPDDRYAYETVEYLRGRLPAAKVVHADSGHGAQMLKGGFSAELVRWAKEECRPVHNRFPQAK